MTAPNGPLLLRALHFGLCCRSKATTDSVLDQLLFILTSTPHASSLQPPAAALLLQLVEGLKASIARATDPMLLCPGSRSRGATGTLAASAVAAAVQNGSIGSSPLKPKAPPPTASSPAKLQAAGAELAAQQQQQQQLPRGPSVPAPLLSIPDSVPPHPEALQRFITSQHALNVNTLAYDLALSLLPHLANPLRHCLLLPLLESLAPLLLLSRDGPISLLQQQQQMLQADNVFLQPGEGWEGGMPGVKGSPGRRSAGAIKGARTGAGARQEEPMGWGGGAAEASAFVKWQSLMQAAAAALVPCLAMARAESPAVVQAYQGDPSIVAPPIINIPSATLVILITRLLYALPASLVQPQLVPPAISDTLAAVARDDVLCAALPPSWRPAALAVLSKLRPDVHEVLEVADEGDQAVQAAQQLVYQLPHLLSGTVAPASWLSLVEMALLALDLAPDTQLLQAIIQGLAFICCADSLEGGEVHAQAEAVLLGLLQHPLLGVQLAVYALMEQMVMEVRGHKDHPLLSLLCRHNVLAHLTTVGLAQPSTRPQVAHVLQELLVRGNTQHNKNLLHWHCWVCANDDDPQAGALASSLSSLQHSSVHELPENAWERAALAVMGLLSRRPETRQGAARDLRDLLHLVHGVLVPTGEPHTADPLIAVLDNGARDDLLLPSASGPVAVQADTSGFDHGTPSTSAYPTSLVLTGPGAAARLARSFTPQHADNLLSILANPALAPELRRSAAEQLLGLTAEPRLLAEICQPQHLAAMLGTLAPHACSPASGASTTTALLTSLDVQLPIAVANLLYACACASSAARAWLLEQSKLPCSENFDVDTSLQSNGPSHAVDGVWMGRSLQQQHMQSGALDPMGVDGTRERRMGGLRGALPLLFHSLLTVRRAVARLLAAVLLQGEADKWEGWGRLVAGADPEAKTGILHLPRPFASGFALPCKVTWLEVKVLPMGAKDRQSNSLCGMPKLQGLVAEQRLIVAQIVEERRLLASAGGSLSGMLQLLNEPPQHSHVGMPHAAAATWQLPPAAAQACSANITALSLCSQVASSLERVRTATSHAECSMALGSLQLLAATRQGAAALALCDWQGALDTLLTSSPATLEDHALWCMLLPLVRRMLTDGVLTPPQLLHLALCLQQSALPLLEEPNAAMGPVPMPVALVGSPVVEQETDSDEGHRLQVVTTAQQVLRTLCALLCCSRARHDVHTTLRIAHALSLPRLLHVLCAGFVRAPEGASYGCRVLAVGVVGEVLAVLKGGQLAEDGAESLANAPGMEDALLLCLTSLLTEVAHSRHTAAPMRFVQQAASQGGTAAAAGVAAAVAAGFRDKGLVHAAMPCLIHLTRLLPMVQWSVVWQQVRAGGAVSCAAGEDGRGQQCGNKCVLPAWMVEWLMVRQWCGSGFRGGGPWTVV
ncbi:hypothetical protein DUNSADRAFT_9818 [Dunaliella salina]|uniref:Uncharacterized protein n=1 Tax=Dunaliella salina TaxID=3046 RepID=A0ABQ7GGL4_DUNSA|nr:hypothetical protein DUNSADRAFT_9818 [Dunaliella salina]|eukprot:KAF5833751.1 hypothetical protein DUNSADRAFT_9818 [Dunaliella salina]